MIEMTGDGHVTSELRNQTIRGCKMAARQWTAEQRERQSTRIHDWQPWLQSTGPKTQSGKAKSSKNAFRLTFRKILKTTNYLTRQQRKFEAGLPCDSIEVMIGEVGSTGIRLSEVKTLMSSL